MMISDAFLQRATQTELCKLKHFIGYGKSVRPSVCPSVRHTPVLCQNEERRRMRSLVFWCQEWLMGDEQTPLST